MNAIRARLAAVLAGFLLATLSAWGIRGVPQEMEGQLALWLEHTFELALFVGYAVLHPWLQRREGKAEAR